MGLVRETPAGSLESASVNAYSAACQSVAGILLYRDVTDIIITKKHPSLVYSSDLY